MRNTTWSLAAFVCGVWLSGCDPRGTYYRAQDAGGALAPRDGGSSDTETGPAAVAGAAAGAGAVADAVAGADAGLGAAPTIRARCFPGVGDEATGLPQYDQFAPVVPSHCAGTGHQSFDNIQKVVFLGDSLTAGTPPTSARDFYRTRLTRALEAKFGPLESKSCAVWGATTDKFFGGSRPQIPECFPGIETKRVLVVITMGGNDMIAVAQGALAGESMAESFARVDRTVAQLRAAIDWFKTNANRFQNGVRIVFANVYEYTDATGDLPSCLVASTLGGLSRAWPEGRRAYIRLSEGYMKVAVETATDMVFLLETFCGHGTKYNDSSNECYRGVGTERWIDFTCLHPTPVGHARVAELFMSVIDGSTGL
ncbi:MAG: SGNH/GDSL hydrolase family protein [Deltaproteobacteria bacterium]|nr:SGNH/GDSL hydrolase family protein [Deltaproteobacteria bacterium]